MMNKIGSIPLFLMHICIYLRASKLHSLQTFCYFWSHEWNGRTPQFLHCQIVHPTKCCCFLKIFLELNILHLSAAAVTPKLICQYQGHTVVTFWQRSLPARANKCVKFRSGECGITTRCSGSGIVVERSSYHQASFLLSLARPINTDSINSRSLLQARLWFILK